MGKYADQARATMARYRKTASTATDEYAIVSPELYEIWQPDKQYYDGNDNIHPQSKVRGLTYPDRLYKCLTGHTSQESWEPDLVPTLWAVIDETHAGTIDDPIPAAKGMIYYKDKYYLDPNGKIYLCTRDRDDQPGAGIQLQYLPSELVGVYFTLVK